MGPAPPAVWKFAGDTGSVDYDPAAAKAIEAAYYSDPKASVDLVIDGHKCRLDFDKMQQTNTDTGGTSPIFRSCSDQPALMVAYWRLSAETFVFNRKVIQIRSSSGKVNAIYDRLGGFKYDATEEGSTKRALKDLKTFGDGSQYIHYQE